MRAITKQTQTSLRCLGRALILGLFLQAGIAAAQNLAANPGFETGDTSGWFAFGSPTISAQTTVVHSGTYAALVSNRSQTYMGIAQSFLGVMQAGQTYNVSVWVQLVSGSNQTMQVTAQQSDGNGTAFIEIASGTVSAGSWTQLSGQFTLSVSGTLTGLTIYIEMPSSATTAYYADDCLIPSPAASGSGLCTVDGNTVFQRIDGFGASSAYRGAWTTAQANMFFSTNSGTGVSLDGLTNFPYTGCGFSLLRNKINYNELSNSTAIPTTSETSIMLKAAALGVQIWSAAWTPPRGFKNTYATNGGSYLGSGNNATNLAYASQIANYVANIKNTLGINLYAISVQNEPDFSANYESCLWTGSQIHDYVTNLHAALVAKGVSSTRILLPEGANWGSNPGLFTPTLNDPTSAAEVGIIADHDYVADNVTGDTNIPASLPASGKAVWETEVSQEVGAFDGSITNALYWAGRIHLFMTVAQANAWHYWWLMSFNGDNEGLTDVNGVPAKRMYALGQFARFVRPNFNRISAVNNNATVLVSAYKDSLSPNFAMVAINSNTIAVTQSFNLTNIAGVASVTPWVTTASLSLSVQSPVTVTNSSFTYTLPPQSIVTFAGQSASNTPPVFAAIGNRTINPGVTLVLTNSATDTDAPPQTLTYSLLAAPTNATLNASNGIFNWRPLLSQANTTNSVSVQVTDSGTPNLHATNSFKITINPVVTPAISVSRSAGRNLNIVMNGAQGPDYSLLTSSNLTSWQVLFTTNSPLLPVTLVGTNTGSSPANFYRVQIGP